VCGVFGSIFQIQFDFFDVVAFAAIFRIIVVLGVVSVLGNNHTHDHCAGDWSPRGRPDLHTIERGYLAHWGLHSYAEFPRFHFRRAIQGLARYSPHLFPESVLQQQQ
jgi:hypothetical protein